VTTDRKGQIYIAGNTRSAEFPTTAGAFQRTGPGLRTGGYITYAFLMKLTPDARSIVFSTLLGGAGNICSGGTPSACIRIRDLGLTGVVGLHVDDREQVLVVGATTSPLFPITQNAFMKTGFCKNWSTTGFLTKFNAAGSALLWSTYFGSPSFGHHDITHAGTFIYDFQVSNDGGVVIAGRVGSSPFPTTPGVLQESYHGPAGTTDFFPQLRTYDGFLSKLSADGSSLVYSTVFGGDAEDSIASLVLGKDDEAPIFSGISESDELPSCGDSIALGSSLVGSVSADARAVIAQHKLPPGIGDRQIRWAADGRLILLGSGGTLVWAALDELPYAALFTIQDSAHTLALTRVAPGELIQLTGAQIGPETTAFAPEPEDRFPTDWNGYQVLFDGVPGPILYLDRHLLRTVAPFALSDREDVRITLRTPRGEATIRTAVVPVQPYVFRWKDGTVFALNEDGTVHSQDNPAAAGSKITLFGSGFGLLDPLPEDGSVVLDGTPRTVLTVVRREDNKPLEAFPAEATAAPGQVAGMVRIVTTVPSAGSAGIQIFVGEGRGLQSGGRVWIKR
jgi:uncharacterized protein (TIGR03437 family)